jgi:hypothetical protein
MTTFASFSEKRRAESLLSKLSTETLKGKLKFADPESPIAVVMRTIINLRTIQEREDASTRS